MKDLGIIIEGGLEEHTRLYRYMPLSQFIAFIEKRQITLSQVISWEDTWEAPSRKIPTKNPDGTLEYPIYSIEEDWFGQCWSLNGQSDAMWRIYSPDKQGILIDTTVEKFKLITDIKYGMLAPVIYYDDLTEILLNTASFHHYKHFVNGYLKRKAFDHEHEARLITINNIPGLGKKHKNVTHIQVDLNPNEFIEGITIDPRASEWYVTTIQKYCNNRGFTIIPQKSNLYSDDIYGATGLVHEWRPV